MRHPSERPGARAPPLGMGPLVRPVVGTPVALAPLANRRPGPLAATACGGPVLGTGLLRLALRGSQRLLHAPLGPT